MRDVIVERFRVADRGSFVNLKRKNEFLAIV